MYFEECSLANYVLALTSYAIFHLYKLPNEIARTALLTLKFMDAVLVMPDLGPLREDSFSLGNTGASRSTSPP